jgi:pyruvate kinase
MNWKEPETLYFGSCKIVIHRPDLSDKDKARIENQIKTNLETVMRSYIRRKEESHGNKGAITKE